MTMLQIDGSAGEGGGQILRTSLALAMCTGQPFALEHIRAGRAKPGLMRQHLTCVNAAAQICDAQVEGARELEASAMESLLADALSPPVAKMACALSIR